MLEFVVFLNCICIGIGTAIVNEFTIVVKRIFQNNKIVGCAVDFSVYFIGGTIVFLCSQHLNNGIFAFYDVIGYFVGLFLLKITCKNLFAKLVDLLYNSIVKFGKKIKVTKIGCKIFK